MLIGVAERISMARFIYLNWLIVISVAYYSQTPVSQSASQPASAVNAWKRRKSEISFVNILVARVHAQRERDKFELKRSESKKFKGARAAKSVAPQQ